MSKIIYNDKVYSSNYTKANRLVINSRQVSIALKTKDGFKGQLYPDLYPTDELLSSYKCGDIDEDTYIIVYYNEILSKLDPVKVYNDLKGKVICCWCESWQFCHRYLVMEWLKVNLGEEIIGGEL